MAQTTPAYNLPAAFADQPFDATQTNATAPNADLMDKGYVYRQSLVGSPEHNFMFGATTAFLYIAQTLGLFLPFNPDKNGQSIIATPKGGCVTMIDSATKETTFWVALTPRPVGYVQPDLDTANWKQISLTDVVPVDLSQFVKKSGDTMPGELINTAAGLGRASPFQAVTAGNAFRWDAPASEEFTCAVGLESENGRAFMTYFAYHGPAQNTFRRSSAQFLPGAWVYEPFSGTLSYLTAPAGTADADITDWT